MNTYTVTLLSDGDELSEYQIEAVDMVSLLITISSSIPADLLLSCDEIDIQLNKDPS